MPKMKTHKGAAKRVKVTGSGRFFMNAHHRGHMRSKKRNETLYSLREMQEVHATHTRAIKRLLPYS
ncbi:MAG: 50S ribosomal protein L35 [Dehalococcoidia bacterium]|nr:50S ribosomal protein L35 [Dehalococcoidia bacterium]